MPTTGPQSDEETTAAAMVVGANRGIGHALVEALLERAGSGPIYAACRSPDSAAALQQLAAVQPRVRPLALDVTDEAGIEAAAAAVKATSPRLSLLINCAGVLHAPGVKPERRLAEVDPAALALSFAVNASGPLLLAKHFHPLLTHEHRAVLANLSARVGSISDNHLGGWYGYRASKAAQNQITRTLSIELGRRARNLVCVALHPGTVDTDLSKPFQSNVHPEKLFDRRRAAQQLLRVLDSLTPAHSGRFYAWDGSEIPW